MVSIFFTNIRLNDCRATFRTKALTLRTVFTVQCSYLLSFRSINRYNVELYALGLLNCVTSCYQVTMVTEQISIARRTELLFVSLQRYGVCCLTEQTTRIKSAAKKAISLSISSLRRTKFVLHRSDLNYLLLLLLLFGLSCRI